MLPLLVWALVAGACSEQAPPPPAAPAPAPAAAPRPPDITPPAQLARESLQAIHDAATQLETAIRQRDTRGGKQDFERFITDPVLKMQFRWSEHPREQNADWVPCIMAVQEELNRYADSWKAGKVVARNSFLSESLRDCEKIAAPKR